MNYRKSRLPGEIDIGLILETLSLKPLRDVIFYTDLLYSELSLGNKLRFNINSYCCGHNDRAGRMRFIETVLEYDLVRADRLPFGLGVLKEQPRKRGYDFYVPRQRAADSLDAPALTDELVVITDPVSVTNPRWEHVDPDRKQSSPDRATIGDVILLMADIKGIPDSASMSFDIFDTTSAPPLRIATAHGKNEKGIGKGKWTIADPNGNGSDLKLEFEGIARSKASTRAVVDLEVEEYVLSL